MRSVMVLAQQPNVMHSSHPPQAVAISIKRLRPRAYANISMQVFLGLKVDLPSPKLTRQAILCWR